MKLLNNNAFYPCLKLLAGSVSTKEVKKLGDSCLGQLWILKYVYFVCI